MALTVTNMYKLLRRGLGGLDSTDLSDADATEYLNLALWELEAKFPFKAKSSSDNITLVIDTYEYTLSSSITRLEAIESIAVLDANGINHKLGRTDRHWLDENFNETDDKGTPTRYLRENDKITFHPIPDAALVMTVTSKVGIIALTTTGGDTTGLPRNWDELVVENAIVKGHFYQQDYNEARQASNFAVQKVRSAVMDQAKEEKADSRYARLNVIWETPEGA